MVSARVSYPPCQAVEQQPTEHSLPSVSMESEALATGMLTHAMHCLCEITDQEQALEQRRRQVQQQTVTVARAEATPDVCDTTTGPAGCTQTKHREQRTEVPFGRASPSARAADSDGATQTAHTAQALPQMIEATTQTPVAAIATATAATSTPPATETSTVATMTADLMVERHQACGAAVCTASHLHNNQIFSDGRCISRAVVSPCPDVVHAPGAIPFSGEVRATAWISGVGWCMRMRGGALVVAFVDGHEDACQDSLTSPPFITNDISGSNGAKFHRTVPEPAAITTRTAGALLSIDRCGKRVALTLTQRAQQGGADGGKATVGARTKEMALAEAARDPAMRKWLQHVPCFMRLMRDQQ